MVAAACAWLLGARARSDRLVQAVITVQASYAGAPPRPSPAVFYHAASEADLSPAASRFETERTGPRIGTVRRTLAAGTPVAFMVDPLDEDGAPEGKPVPWSFAWPDQSGTELTLTILRPYPKPAARAQQAPPTAAVRTATGPAVRVVSRARGSTGAPPYVAGAPSSNTASAAGPSVVRHPSSVICIDPGHPSEINDGLEVQNGTTETHCDWAVALKLRRRLEEDGFRVVMTKSAEREMVANERRAEIANACAALVMVRLHCDDGTHGRGFRVFYPDAPGRHEGVVGPSHEVCAESARAARAIHAGLAAGLRSSLRDNDILTDRSTKVGGTYGALIGSIHSRVPTVTVEMVFLSDARDAAFIRSEAGQQAMADALAEGVRAYAAMR